jgi:hypothetical protein
MNYSQNDLPVRIHHGEMVTLDDGTVVRYDSNGDAKDVFLDDSYAPTVQLFPDCDHVFTAGGNTFKVTALFEDALIVEKL